MCGRCAGAVFATSAQDATTVKKCEREGKVQHVCVAGPSSSPPLDPHAGITAETPSYLARSFTIISPGRAVVGTKMLLVVVVAVVGVVSSDVETVLSACSDRPTLSSSDTLCARQLRLHFL